LALVLFAHVHTLYHHTVRLGQDTNHFSTLAFIFQATIDHFNQIAFANLDYHSTHSSPPGT
jgi:hypothetical protein